MTSVVSSNARSASSGVVCEAFPSKKFHHASIEFNIYNYNFLFVFAGCSGNPDAKRLYDDLLSNYNKLVRPVVNVTDALTVKIKLKLSQLIDVVR